MEDWDRLDGLTKREAGKPLLTIFLMRSGWGGLLGALAFGAFGFWFLIGDPMLERVSPAHHAYRVSRCLMETEGQYASDPEYPAWLRSCYGYQRILIFF